MAFEFLNEIYFGNSVESWLLFFGTIIVFVILGKVLEIILSIITKNFAQKTKSDFDDKLIQAIKKPLISIVTVLGIMIGTIWLNFSPEITEYISNGINLVWIALGTWLAINLVDSMLTMSLHPITSKSKTKYDDQIVQILSKILKIIILAFAVIIALDSFGIDVFTLIAGLGIGGIAIAFAAKETIEDMFGGTSILLSKPFILGDFIEFDGNIGKVNEISLRYTRITNLDKRTMVIPNGMLAKTIITNISSAPKRKTIWKIGVPYNTSNKKLEKAKTIITKAINDCKLCDDNPVVKFDEFADSSLNIFVMFFTKTGEWIEMVNAKDEIGTNIKKEFEKSKIDFAFPTQTIHLEK